MTDDRQTDRGTLNDLGDFWCLFFLQSSALGAQGGMAMSIIGAEDEDFENDIEPVSGEISRTNARGALRRLSGSPTWKGREIRLGKSSSDGEPFCCGVPIARARVCQHPQCNAPWPPLRMHTQPPLTCTVQARTSQLIFGLFEAVFALLGA
ncbi:hypothetical protein L345_14913, partial [Ophiophagus hannah]